MAWENPIKVARLCFFETGQLKDYFMNANDNRAVDQLVGFLAESEAVIVELENFSKGEIELLEKRKGPNGRSLFATHDCPARGNPNMRHCARICPFNSESEILL